MYNDVVSVIVTMRAVLNSYVKYRYVRALE